jgi:hypothetical protein
MSVVLRLEDPDRLITAKAQVLYRADLLRRCAGAIRLARVLQLFIGLGELAPLGARECGRRA